jgi:hypothetical protein
MTAQSNSTMNPGAAPSRCSPSRPPGTGIQPETLRTIVSIRVRDQVLLTADRAIAKQAPPNIFVRTGFPVVEHFLEVHAVPSRLRRSRLQKSRQSNSRRDAAVNIF